MVPGMPSKLAVPEHRRLTRQPEAAAYAGVCTRTIRRMISRGELTGYRLGQRLILVDLNELDAALRPIPAVAS